MSEYQYYDFLAIDRPLNLDEIKELRKLSTRAEITATRFTNTYNWGDFGGSPIDMMKKYFDAHIYVTNWGVYEFMLRFPRVAIDEDLLSDYCFDDPFQYHKTKDYIIVIWQYDSEGEGEWEEGEGWMEELIQIRNEILNGDYRAFYIGWLLAVDYGLMDEEDEIEPEVPPGLTSPTAAQKSLIEFLHLDRDLVKAASKASEPFVPEVDQEEDMRACIDQLRNGEMKALLLRVMQGESMSVQNELRMKYSQFRKNLKAVNTKAEGKQLRTVQQMLELTREERQQRLKREELARQRKIAEENRKRREYLAGLVDEFPDLWDRVERLADEKKAASYKQAVEILVDLADAYELEGREEEFMSVFFAFATRRKRQTALIRRIEDAELELPF